jgi:hypothetical protein
VLAGRPDVVEAPDRAEETHRSRPVGSAVACPLRPYFWCLPEWKGSVGGDPVDRSLRSVQDHERLHRRRMRGREPGMGVFVAEVGPG